MATVPAGTKFLGVDPSFTDLTERKGTKVDRKTEYFSLEDLQDSISSGGDYKVYRAILNQTGTSAPVATVLENTIGSIVWSRSSQGTYLATLSGAFLANKTYYPTFGMSDSFNRVYINRISDNAIRVRAISEDLTTNLDNELFNFPIEIIVYN